ncbi:hypothetical protein BZL54_20090 [Burkholderia ubonensis subsp. mesacidophila]|uniref:Uncharacterized protein n=2 Tax=Burkholderia ubonensis TaxID=101571 RepID=A0A2A4FA49_9BURK|nr:hypothetical protein BZL54_20090 [Burkholderia ubonensis subsp. mesacidophila]
MNNVRDKNEVETKGELNELFDCEFKEILLLLDYLAGRADKDFTIPSNGTVTGKTTHEIIKEVWGRANRAGEYQEDDVAFLFETKNSLNRLAYPASGITIAYTYMFVEDEKILPGPFLTDPGGTRYSRIGVAKDAFPGAVAHARRFRRLKDQMSLWVTLITVIAAILLSIVAFGAQVISRFEQDRTANMKSIDDLYSTLAKQGAPIGDTKPPLKLIKEHCELPDLNNQTYQIIELCNEYSYNAARYDEAIRGVSVYGESWAFRLLSFMFEIPPVANAQENARSVAIVLSTFSSYILPILFAVIGSFAASARGIYEKIKEGVLAPRDRILALVRLPLGLIAGVSVGLFFDPSSVVTHVSMGLGLSLSAAAIAFAAGYGAETFFSKIDTLINYMIGGRRSE